MRIRPVAKGWHGHCRHQLKETWVDKKKNSRPRPSDSWKVLFSIFCLFWIFGQATFSSSTFLNGGFYASAKIEIDLISPTPPYPPKIFLRILRNWKIDFWENWRGHVHPIPPRGDATGHGVSMPPWTKRMPAVFRRFHWIAMAIWVKIILIEEKLLIKVTFYPWRTCLDVPGVQKPKKLSLLSKNL